MQLTFHKYQGTGNDFVVIDDRALHLDQNDAKRIAQLCDRRFGIGADGLILLQNDDEVDFKMVYFNADGQPSSMCGNGGRCIVAFARDLGLISNTGSFRAVDGLHTASIAGDLVALAMNPVTKVETHADHFFTDTGSPHHVTMAENLSAVDVFKEGRKIRYGAPYGEAGSNVNFVEKRGEDTFGVRTYERGVEGETLSCGTGVTAVALAMHASGRTNAQDVSLETPGGELRVRFEVNGLGYKNIELIGPAQFVFKGSIQW